MTNIKKIIAVLFIFIFLWMLFVSAVPLKSKGLNGRYNICDIANLNSWQPAQAKLPSIKAQRFIEERNDNYIEFLYPKQKERPLFMCKSFIPAEVVYKARSINARIKINQPAEFNLGLATGGIGPAWKASIKKEDINKPVNLSWSLEREQSTNTLKLNWLPKYFTGGGIFVEKTEPDKDLIITIFELYLN